MSPLEASSILATLVGLLCNWKQERGAVVQDRFQDFITWLTHHQFNELRNKIQESDQLGRELTELLREDNSELSKKLDVLAQGLSSLSTQVVGVASLSRAIGSPQHHLSEQAVAILKLFDQQGHPRMLIQEPHPSMPNNVVFLPGGTSFQFRNLRFVEDDVSQLCSFGFIRQVDSNRDGCPIYALTRSGSAFAQELPELKIPQRPETSTLQPR